MSYEEIRCKDCGVVVSKEDIHCKGCGAPLKPISTGVADNKTETSSLLSSKLEKWKSLKPGYKKLTFYIIVTVADLITSLIVMVSAGLPLDIYWILFFGLYLLILIIGTIIKGAIVDSEIKDHLAKGIAIMIFVVLFIVIIVIPLYLITFFQLFLGTISFTIDIPPGLQAIFDQISNAILQAMSNILGNIWETLKAMFSPAIESINQSLDNIEVPGFEPILLISVLVVISIMIIYKYHLKVKKSY
ncbi:MAG: hypothetical protein ACFFBP_14575 [Promethearchaeota archaeon]